MAAHADRCLVNKIAATDRMARLIAAIPWIVSQDGASVDDIAERFDYPREALLDDLRNVVFFVGVPPYTPDTLIEVQIDDDMVWIRYADWFSKPMRLTGAEALALLAAGETVLSFDHQDEAGPLARGLAKLRLASGVSKDSLDVQLGVAPESVLADLRRAVAEGFCVDIGYYSFARDQRTERRIEPRRFFSDDGNWYVAGHCHLADGDRVFRVDRIDHLEVTDLPVSTHTDDRDGDSMFSIDEAPRVTLAVPTDRLRVLDRLPIDSMSEPDDGVVVVVLAASSTRWLERLLLRLGPGATVTNADPEIGTIDISTAASRVLDRYLRHGLNTDTVEQS
ncbi:MAG: helix-turn-helix transcriptional regulator [Acidimicrobiales bacterium]